jgi:hypothetical protein
VWWSIAFTHALITGFQGSLVGLFHDRFSLPVCFTVSTQRVEQAYSCKVVSFALASSVAEAEDSVPEVQSDLRQVEAPFEPRASLVGTVSVPLRRTEFLQSLREIPLRKNRTSQYAINE